MPNKNEWNTLFTAVGGSLFAGIKLKSKSGWNSEGNGTDDFGFSALPAGRRNISESYSREGNYAFFWGSDESDSADACYMYLRDNYDGAYLDYDMKGYGFSVRCLQD